MKTVTPRGRVRAAEYTSTSAKPGEFLIRIRRNVLTENNNDVEIEIRRFGVACRTEVIASSVLQTSQKTAVDKSILERSERKEICTPGAASKSRRCRRKR
jgi:hypothetical protein